MGVPLQVAAKLEPVLFPAGAVIAERGKPGSAVFYISKGRCREGDSEPPRALSAGDFIGIRSCLFLESPPGHRRILVAKVHRPKC